MSASQQLVPDGLRFHTWNVQGLGGIARGTVKGAELLRNFKAVGEYDFFLIQEHKLPESAIPFVHCRIGTKKASWSQQRGVKGASQREG